MKITTVGVDLAKTVFQIHAADKFGRKVHSRKLRRTQMLAYFVRLEPCKVAMEACGSAHYWGRKLTELGHEVMLIAPQYVKPYVRGDKTDAADAQAICEAATRPDMPTVAIKTASQQAVLSSHRARAGFVKARTAAANQIRGLLAEFGITLPQGIRNVTTQVPAILEDGEQDLPGEFRQLMLLLVEHFKLLDERVQQLDEQILRWHRSSEASMRLAEIPGVGVLTASAMVASVGDARHFKSGKQLAAWLGLAPRQHSSGGQTNMLGISKRGDNYLRTLLVHGARAKLRCTPAQADSADWSERILARRHKNIACVAQAHKTARIIWALLTHDRRFRLDYACAVATA